MHSPPLALKISALADKRMRIQLGALCVHWALLELMVERAIAVLEGRGGNVTYSEDLARRLVPLKELARQKLPPDKAAAVVSVAEQIATLCHDRHHVIHGLWGMDENGNYYSIHPRTKLQKAALPQNAQTIRKVKLEAHRLHDELASIVPPTLQFALALKNKQWPAAPRNPQHPAPTPSADTPQPPLKETHD